MQIDWGVVLLYGGGFALGVLSFQTGLAEAMGRGLTGLLPIEGSFGMLVAAVVVAVILSETTSNTAAANMVVPVVISIARAAGLDPLEPALGATMAASLGFMLPVSTPCNAIVYGSGYIPLQPDDPSWTGAGSGRDRGDHHHGAAAVAAIEVRPQPSPSLP